MSEENTFRPLPPDKIKECTDSLEIAYQLIAVTLVDEAILIGALAKDWRWDGQVLSLGFNTEEGKQFGHSHIVNIPISLIADIQPIPLSEASIPKVAPDDPSLAFLKELGLAEKYARLPVQDYPNPLASIICKHNLPIASAHGFTLLGYVEKALSKDAIPPEGISLEDDLLLYADWAFFSQQASGAWNISVASPFFSVSKDLSPSPRAVVIRKLRDSWAERVRKKLSPEVMQDNLLQGRIVVPKPPEDTEIEGEKCIVTLCTTDDVKMACPVLLKVNCLKYPREFLGYINSVLTFYGELLPIPLIVKGRSYKNALLARAIAHLSQK